MANVQCISCHGYPSWQLGMGTSSSDGESQNWLYIYICVLYIYMYIILYYIILYHIVLDHIILYYIIIIYIYPTKKMGSVKLRIIKSMWLSKVWPTSSVCQLSLSIIRRFLQDPWQSPKSCCFSSTTQWDIVSLNPFFNKVLASTSTRDLFQRRSAWPKAHTFQPQLHLKPR